MAKKNEEKMEVATIDNSVFVVSEAGTAPTIRYTTTDSESRLFNAVNGSADSRIADILGTPFDIVDIIISTATVHSEPNNEDSPKVDKPCVHFFTVDGLHFSSISNGIARSAKNLIGCGLTPTQERPIKIVFKEINTKKGKAHTFDMV